MPNSRESHSEGKCCLTKGFCEIASGEVLLALAWNSRAAGIHIASKSSEFRMSTSLCGISDASEVEDNTSFSNSDLFIRFEDAGTRNLKRQRCRSIHVIRTVNANDTSCDNLVLPASSQDSVPRRNDPTYSLSAAQLPREMA